MTPHVVSVGTRVDDEAGRRHRPGPGHALGRRRRDHLARLIAGQSRASARIEHFDVSTTCRPDRRRGARGRRPTAAFQRRPTISTPKDQRKIDDFIIYRHRRRARRRCEDSGWEPQDEEERERTGVMIGSGIGGLATHRRDGASILNEKRPAAREPVLHPGEPDQSRLGPGLDQLRLQGPEPLGGHRLLDRGARDRRRRAPDQARGCRRDGGRRHRGGDLPDRHRRLRRLPGAVDRFQRHARAGVAAVGQATATASSWARAPASWCSRRYEHAKGAAPRSMPR